MAGAVLLTTVGKEYVGRIRPPAELALPPLQHEVLWDYLERAAHSLVNSPG